MSNLPHPLGDTNPGEIFYPGSPTVTVADAAGAGGSRAVEYGEDGLSAAPNRMGYALGKNDEYMQARLESKIAKPEFTTFTPSGGSGGNYAFATVDVWVGDATYLPETQAIRDSLFSVLDSDYNELLDTSGNKVVVKEVRNAGDTASIVGDTAGGGGDGDGFYNVGGGALIKFKTVHPVTGAVVSDPYTIPDGTGVIIAHGISGTLDTLATGGSEHLMRDALVKGTIRNAHEIDGASFLVDGSRPMRGVLNMDGYNVENLVGLVGVPATSLTILSDDELNLKDTHLAAPVGFSQAGETGIHSIAPATWTSLVGALNSKTRVNESIHGNRPLNRTGAITYTGGTGAVNYPDLHINLGGDEVIIGGGSVTAANGSLEALVVDAGGSIQQRAAGAGVAGDVLISWHYWTGAAFTTAFDVRSAMDGRTESFDITVGDGLNGCDFTTLKQAVDFCTAAAAVWNVTIPNRILIIGNVSIDEQIEITIPTKIEGRCTAGSPFPSITCTGDPAINAIDCNGHKVEIKDVQFTWGHTANQNTGLGAILDPGDGSRLVGCTFSGAGFNWANGIIAGTNDRTRLFFQDCYFLDIVERGIDGGAYFNTTKITKCRFGSTGVTSLDAIRLQSVFNVIEDCIIDASAAVGGIILGPGGTAVRNKMTGDTTGVAIFLDDTLLTGAWEWTVKENRILSFLRCIDIATTVSIEPKVVIADNYLSICDVGIQLNNNSSLDPMSDFTIKGNTFDGCAVSGVNVAVASYCAFLNVIGNQYRSCGGTPIWIRGYASDVYVERNNVSGFGTGAGDSALKISMSGQYGDIQVLDNSLKTAVGQSTSAYIAVVSTDNVLFRGNQFDGSGTRMAGIDAGTADVSGLRVEGNKFLTLTICVTVATLTADRGAEIDNNVFDDFTTIAIRFIGGRGTKINNNTFRDAAGRPIYVNSDATHHVLACNITVNIFENVDGFQGGLVSQIDTASTLITGLKIEGNIFYDCGYTTSGQQSRVITAFVAAVIKGNIITATRGVDGTASNFTSAIYVNTPGCLIEGNQIVQDISANVVEDFYGIWCNAEGCIISSNVISITGTITTMTSVRAILCASAYTAGIEHDNNVVTGNLLSEWTGTGASNVFIQCDGDGCVLANNRAIGIGNGYDISAVGTGGMVIGNLASGAGSTVAGGTNYPSAGTLLTDLNKA